MSIHEHGDWRYNEQRMRLRARALNIILEKYGGLLNESGEPLHTNEKMYSCVHDWVSAGHSNTNGLVKYFEAYYESL